MSALRAARRVLEAHEPPEARGLRRDERAAAGRRPGRRTSPTHASRDLPQFLAARRPRRGQHLGDARRGARRHARRRAARSSCRALDTGRRADPSGSGSSSCAAPTARRFGVASRPASARAPRRWRRAEILGAVRRACGSGVARARPAARRCPRTSHGTGARSATATSRAPGRSSAYQNVYARRARQRRDAERRPAVHDGGHHAARRSAAFCVAPIVLHTGVASQEGTSARTRSATACRQTARLVNAVHALGRPRRSRSGPPSSARSRRSPARRVVEHRRGLDEPGHDARARRSRRRRPDHRLARARVVAPRHAQAIGGERLIMESYNAALEHGYRWHEFGDSQLIFGDARSGPGTPRSVLSD